MAEWWEYQNHTPPQVVDHDEADTGLIHPSGRKIVRRARTVGFLSDLKPEYALGEVTDKTEDSKETT